MHIVMHDYKVYRCVIITQDKEYSVTSIPRNVLCASLSLKPTPSQSIVSGLGEGESTALFKCVHKVKYFHNNTKDLLTFLVCCHLY